MEDDDDSIPPSYYITILTCMCVCVCMCIKSARWSVCTDIKANVLHSLIGKMRITTAGNNSFWTGIFVRSIRSIFFFHIKTIRKMINYKCAWTRVWYRVRSSLCPFLCDIRFTFSDMQQGQKVIEAVSYMGQRNVKIDSYCETMKNTHAVLRGRISTMFFVSG